jgi:hypothetical protein
VGKELGMQLEAVIVHVGVTTLPALFFVESSSIREK